MIENYLDNQEQTMQATLTSRRDHNFRVNNRKENQCIAINSLPCMKETGNARPATEISDRWQVGEWSFGG